MEKDLKIKQDCAIKEISSENKATKIFHKIMFISLVIAIAISIFSLLSLIPIEVVRNTPSTDVIDYQAFAITAGLTALTVYTTALLFILFCGIAMLFYSITEIIIAVIKNKKTKEYTLKQSEEGIKNGGELGSP